ncbi:MAG: RelA/SpoT family protein [Mycoplasmatales bacterium]
MSTHTYSSLQKILKTYMTEEDIEYIHSVYLFSNKAHESQIRKSGEPYIIHPIAVAEILADKKLSPVVIAASLLHDVVEDTQVTLEEIEVLFGKDVKTLVDGVTKLTNIDGYSLDKVQADNHKKIILSAAKDIRIILIKLADRLHNIRTISNLNEAKQKIIANETLEVYAPIAHRLGMYNVKWELEDLCFKILNPTAYQEIADKLDLKKEQRDEIVHQEIEKLNRILEENEVDAKIFGRSKHIYSIYRKITEKKQVFEELTDLFAFRIITKTIPDCYLVLGILHENYKPIPMRFKDYIPTPKHNMYQSIHTTVIARDGIPMEIQIRTKEMDDAAEHGIASHWNYKEGKELDQEEIYQRVDWLKQALELDDEDISSSQFMTRFKEDAFTKSIFAYTPKGDSIELPENSTVLDFAFYVHTELGYKAISAKVNDKIVSLFYKLKIGDVVTIITSKNADPNYDWIYKVKTSRAKDSLRKFFKEDRKKSVRDEGRKFLIKYAESNGIENIKTLIDNDEIYIVMDKFGFGSKEDFFYAIGIGELEFNDIVLAFKKKKPKAQKIKKLNDVVIKHARKPFEYHLCKYCSPYPGDNIKAVKTDSKYISRYYIHRKECYQPYKESEALWTDNLLPFYKVRLEAIVKDEVGSINSFIQSLSNDNVNISSVYARGNMAGKGKVRISLELKSSIVLNEYLNNIKQNDSVISVTRIVDKGEMYDID